MSGRYYAEVRKRYQQILFEGGETVPTSKTEPGHGFGLSTIQEAAGRLDGEMEIQNGG